MKKPPRQEDLNSDIWRNHKEIVMAPWNIGPICLIAKCSSCAVAREIIAEGRELMRQKAAETGIALKLSPDEFICKDCGGTGFALTDDGKTLLLFVAQHKGLLNQLV